MEQGNFTKEFTTLQEMGDSTFVLRGSTLVVEIIADEELKTKSGLIIATDPKHTRGGSVEQHRLQTGRVLMTGQGYWNDEKNSYEKLEVVPGAIVILPQYATQFVSVFPGILRPTNNKIALVKMAELLGYYPSEEAYEAAKAKLNA